MISIATPASSEGTELDESAPPAYFDDLALTSITLLTKITPFMKGELGMKSATRRKQQQDELRAKILDAARELFVAHGVEAVSMRKVAEKIGYTATTLYNHFEDKDALLHAPLRCPTSARFTSRFSHDRRDRRPDRAAAQARSGVHRVCTALSEPLPPHVHDAASAREMTMPATRANVATPTRTPTHSCGRRSSKRSPAGLFRDDYQDPDLLSQVFWSGVHGVAALHLIMGEDNWVQWRPVEEVAQTAIELMIRGLVRGGRGSKGKNGG